MKEKIRKLINTCHLDMIRQVFLCPKNFGSPESAGIRPADGGKKREKDRNMKFIMKPIRNMYKIPGAVTLLLIEIIN